MTACEIVLVNKDFIRSFHGPAQADPGSSIGVATYVFIHPILYRTYNMHGVEVVNVHYTMQPTRTE